MTKKKKISIFILLAVILVFMMFLSILSGSVYIKPHDVFNVLTGNDSSSVNALLIFNIRLPRMIAGVFAGMGLACAGVILQSVMNNSLASPNTIGVNSRRICRNARTLFITEAHHTPLFLHLREL